MKGQGILYFKRTNHFHGSPWHYEIDGRDTIVKDTATDDPIDAKTKYTHTTFLPEALFPHPLAHTWATKPLPIRSPSRSSFLSIITWNQDRA